MNDIKLYKARRSNQELVNANELVDAMLMVQSKRIELDDAIRLIPEHKDKANYIKEKQEEYNLSTYNYYRLVRKAASDEIESHEQWLSREP